MATFLDPTVTPFMATFFFVFALVFGLLTATKMISDRKVNAIIALAIAAFSTFYEPLVVGLQAFIPLATIFFILLFFLLMLKKVFEKEKGKEGDTLPMVVAIALLLIAMSVLGDEVVQFLPVGIDTNMFLWIVGFFLIVVIFYGVWSRKEGETPK